MSEKECLYLYLKAWEFKMPPLRKKTLKRKANKEVAEEQKEQGSDIETSSGDDDEFPDVSDEEIEENSGGEEEDDVDVKEITVEFEFFGPEEKDFLGLKALLSNFLNGELFDSSGMIDAVISEVGAAAALVHRKIWPCTPTLALMYTSTSTQASPCGWVRKTAWLTTGSPGLPVCRATWGLW